MNSTKIKQLVNEMLEDNTVQWQEIGGQLRALVDGSKYTGFPTIIGHGPKGQGTMNTIRVSVSNENGDIVIKNVFPSTSIQ